ncbi:MAG TPA: 2Fe-2S iron-sulfur cluster-binding protein, partial [Dokdonella sp.]|uniref:ferredoxin reductase n=1 Tax=Dokdonella sp. TaxID=2291710 RepID=UPI002D80BF93
APVLPVWSLSAPRARVVRVVDEGPGVRSLWLRPNRRFKGFVPGQHLMLDLEIDGARHGRCFSLSAAPRSDGLLRLTIREQAGGRVSGAAHALARGQVVRISQSQGRFAPKSETQPLLLISAGSGVTPMMSLAQGMANGGSSRDVILLHSGRGADDTVFAAELIALAESWPSLRLKLHDSRQHGRLDSPAINAAVPDWKEREALLCGPSNFMQMVKDHYADAGSSDQLQCESFGQRVTPIDPLAASHSVTVEKPEHLFTAKAGQSLLEAAENAGLSPRYGCRRGICRSCQCRKTSGSVRNLLTGELSGPGDELIQLCISTPQSAVQLVL